jgi:haloalkane dehalogenase
MTSILRTPDERFENLPEFPFSPNYLEIEDEDFGLLRVHYLEEGPRDGRVILCLHGEPTWCYLYRKMIPLLVDAGFRVVAPDLVGFGRSDKLSERMDYSYARHVQWIAQLIRKLELRDITLIGQDWGGLIGLRLVTEDEERFAAFSLSNTGLPTGDQKMSDAFLRWQRFSQEDPEFDIGFIANLFGHGDLTEGEIEAYRAPFPSDEFKAGARQFPMLVPCRPDDPASGANRKAWLKLTQWEKPVLMCFSDGDPVTQGADKPFFKLVPGTRGQPHTTLHGRHFIQEEDGERWAQVIIDWLKAA